MAKDTIYFSEEQSEEAVISRMDPAKVDPRLYEVTTSLVKHLHAFVKEVEPTNEEWMAGIKFLTETGHLCSDWRQEFILLSDVLGVSMLVETINNRKPSGATETTVLGPFHIEGAPYLENGANICLDGKGEPMVVRGRVTDTEGKPICRRAARPVAGQRGRLLRRPAEGHPARHESARHLHHRRGRALLVPLCQAALLPDPGRWHGGQASGGPRPPSLPAGPCPFHRRCRGFRANRHALFRAGRSLPGQRRGVRRQGKPDRRLHAQRGRGGPKGSTASTRRSGKPSATSCWQERVSAYSVSPDCGCSHGSHCRPCRIDRTTTGLPGM